MSNEVAMLLGMVTLTHKVTKEEKMVEVRGFDVLGFFFPFLRYLFAGQMGNAAIAFVLCCTVIGYPVLAWYTGFNFKKKNFEHHIKEGWEIKKEAQPKVA